jgi:hypothetical protein
MHRIGDDMNDIKDHPFDRLVENSATYAVGAILVFAGVAAGWLDGWYGLVLLGVAACGSYNWFQKRKTSK